MFLSTLNNLDVLVGDVGNAYLHANTNEKVYSVAGPEFGEHQGKTIRIVKSLYGLRTSHIRWRNFLNNDLRAMNFTPSKVDADLWYHDSGDHYEYIAVYVDDIMVFSRRADQIMAQIQEKYKMKGVGKHEIYLGGNIGYHDPTGVLYMSAEKYNDGIIYKLEDLFESTLHCANSPMDASYHPELDESAFLGEEEHSHYRMLIGSAQWAITLGRFDIAYATNTLARYSALPRKGHLEALLRVFR